MLCRKQRACGVSNTLGVKPGGFCFGDDPKPGPPRDALAVAISLPLHSLIWPF